MISSPAISRSIAASGVVLALVGLGWLLFTTAVGPGSVLPLVKVPGVEVGVVLEADPGASIEGAAGWREDSWRPWTARDYLSARPGEVIWLRVRLANSGSKPIEGVLADQSYFSDRVDFWQSDGSGGWEHAVSGDAVQSAEKAWWGRTAALVVKVPPHRTQLIYLRVSDAYLAHVQPEWWPRLKDYHAVQIRTVCAEAICHGALLALVLYNLGLWARLRFADTGWYVLTAFGSSAFNFTANGGLALLGVAVASPWRELVVAAAFSASSVGMLQFARVFLGTRELLPRADRWLRSWRWVLAGGAVGVMAMPWMASPVWVSVVAFGALLTDVFCVSAAVAAWSAGVRHARFFVAAFAVLFLAAMPALVSLMRGELLPGTALALLAGRVIEMLLLSFAMADRFAQTQRALFEETEQRRAIEEAYADELTQEVRERTRELRQANADKDRILTVLGHDLRSPLTGLVRAADQPTSLLAGDVTRTGRALLLLIEDLVLWARLRAGTKQIAVHPVSALTAPAVALHRALADHSGIELIVDVPVNVQVRTDLVLAQTLVRNLLANALKFAESRVVLRASVNRDGDIRFVVGNDGPPLPTDVAARFAAGKDEPITATGGLGLRLCREICGVLGTRLEAEESGAGTQFCFTLNMTAGLGAHFS